MGKPVTMVNDVYTVHVEDFVIIVHSRGASCWRGWPILFIYSSLYPVCSKGNGGGGLPRLFIVSSFFLYTFSQLIVLFWLRHQTSKSSVWSSVCVCLSVRRPHKVFQIFFPTPLDTYIMLILQWQSNFMLIDISKADLWSLDLEFSWKVNFPDNDTNWIKYLYHYWI
jgi:hypothetical protein